MREIKFKSWDGRILSTNYIYFNNSKGRIEIANKFKLIEYSQLKDEKGKEIYEGDILSEKWKVEVYKSITGNFMIKFHNNPIVNKRMTLYDYLIKRRKAGCPEDCEIIGNIYENPELIK